jgi:hypothetical protein
MSTEGLQYFGFDSFAFKLFEHFGELISEHSMSLVKVVVERKSRHGLSDRL